MCGGDTSPCTDKQTRQAERVAASERDKGRSKQDAERIAWAAVNKQDDGGTQSGSGRKGS
ncbi:Transcriptional regulator [Luteimonas sp. 9C]|nr:Transcriptional regulator [Luteimonas sp. 9C]